MKRFIPLLLCFCLILTGCGAASLREDYQRFSAQLGMADSLSFAADLTAYYDDRLAEFELFYTENADGAVVEIRTPELIRGVKASVDKGGTQLQYEGVILDTGPLSDYGLCPMSALPVIVDAIKSGHADSFRTEGDSMVVELVPDDNTVVSVWFDRENMIPVKAEIICDGRLRTACVITDWS